MADVKSKKTLENETNKKNSVKTDKNQLLHELPLSINFVIKRSERINLRKDMLEDRHVHCMNEELYDCFVNRLIDFEENLLIS